MGDIEKKDETGKQEEKVQPAEPKGRCADGACAAETKPMPRSSMLMLLLLAVALTAAVAALLIRPFFTYAELTRYSSAGKRDGLLRKLEGQGPVGNELARKYVAGAFQENRAAGAYMVVKFQSLFIALSLATVEEYLGKADQQAGVFWSYRVGEDKLMSVQVLDGVVRAVYMDAIEKGAGKPKPGAGVEEQGAEMK
jgi:hypothetical protein